nr:hypothetical protein CFP56_72340 [Quercus suber]
MPVEAKAFYGGVGTLALLCGRLAHSFRNGIRQRIHGVLGTNGRSNERHRHELLVEVSAFGIRKYSVIRIHHPFRSANSAAMLS